jgi:hypothetical protein
MRSSASRRVRRGKSPDSPLNRKRFSLAGISLLHTRMPMQIKKLSLFVDSIPYALRQPFFSLLLKFNVRCIEIPVLTATTFF